MIIYYKRPWACLIRIELCTSCRQSRVFNASSADADFLVEHFCSMMQRHLQQSTAGLAQDKARPPIPPKGG